MNISVGQHSRICREGKAVIRHLIRTEEYKYSYIEKQTKRKLEVHIQTSHYCLFRVCMYTQCYNLGQIAICNQCKRS